MFLSGDKVVQRYDGLTGYLQASHAWDDSGRHPKRQPSGSDISPYINACV